MLSAVLLLFAAGAPAAVSASSQPLAATTEPDPAQMSSSEIRANNARLPRDHPYYIRCVRVEETGSLVRRHASCRTNEQWAATDEAGNREARDIGDRMSSKATPGE